MTVPWSMTQMSCARWSASSRYWVVSSSVVPPATSSWMTSQSCWRLRGSRPVVGSSMNITGGLTTSAAARSSLRRIPPEYVLEGRFAASVEVEPLQQLVGPLPGRLRAELVELADHLDVLAAGQVLVDGGELAGQADLPPHLVGVLQYVDARDDGPAAVGLEQGGQDPYGGGLPRAVRPQQAEDGAFRHIEIHSPQCPDIAEGLHETFGVDGARHVFTPVRCCVSPAALRCCFGAVAGRGRRAALPRYNARMPDAIYRVNLPGHVRRSPCIRRPPAPRRPRRSARGPWSPGAPRPPPRSARGVDRSAHG